MELEATYEFEVQSCSQNMPKFGKIITSQVPNLKSTQYYYKRKWDVVRKF